MTVNVRTGSGDRAPARQAGAERVGSPYAGGRPDIACCAAALRFMLPGNVRAVAEAADLGKCRLSAQGTPLVRGSSQPDSIPCFQMINMLDMRARGIGAVPERRISPGLDSGPGAGVRRIVPMADVAGA